MRDWYAGTGPDGDWVSMAVPSDGSYGVPSGLVFSFPVTIDPSTRDWSIVQGLEFNEFAQQKIEQTTKVGNRRDIKLGLGIYSLVNLKNI